MKINSFYIVGVYYKINIIVCHGGKLFELSIVTKDGKVVGDADTGVKTSNISYLEIPLRMRQWHFNRIKKYIEARNK